MNFFRFSSNFRKFSLSKNLWVVFANRFDRLPKNFLSGVRNLFVKIYPIFVTFDRFFKKKFENSKKSDKIHIYSQKFAEYFKSMFLPPREWLIIFIFIPLESIRNTFWISLETFNAVLRIAANTTIEQDD